MASPSRRPRAALALRAAAIALALAAATDPALRRPTARPRELLVALHAAPPSSVPRPSGDDPVVVRASDDAPSAVAAALAARDADADARLVLVTTGDGADPGRAASALAAAVRAGVPAMVVAAPLAPAPAVAAPEPRALAGLVLPAGIVAGVPFLPRPVYRDGGAAPAPAWHPAPGLRTDLFVDGRPEGGWGGAWSFDPAVALEAGPHVLAARCTAADGTPAGEVFVPVVVPGPPRVLLVEDGPDRSPLGAALEAQRVPVTRVRPAEAAGALAGHAVVILGEGATTASLGDTARVLEDAVRDGTGLLAVGGVDDAAGLGRLRGGAIAGALPVFLPPPPRAAPPPVPPPPPPAPPPAAPRAPGVLAEEGVRPGAVVSLLLVVDTSGSMGGMKMEMARRAAGAAAEALAPEDRFGLLSFSDVPQWEVPLGPAGDAAGIRGSLRRLRPGGGTDLLPALQEARRSLAREATAVRHVVVLSDGETSPFGLRETVDAMVREGVTVSAVGIGADFDARLLGNLAAWGRGRTWPAVDPETLPQVVTLDTRAVMAAGKEASKGTPVPDVPVPTEAAAAPVPRSPPPAPPAAPATVAVEEDEPSALVAGLGPWPPAVPPDAAPEPRLATAVALRFAGGRGPALVLGRHGLGRTAALVPSAGGAAWTAWDGYAPAMARIVRGLAPATPPSPVAVLEPEAGADGTRVRFEVRGEGTMPLPRVEALRPSGDSPAAVPVGRLGARRFAALLPPGTPGHRTLVLLREGEPPVPFGAFDPGPPPPDRPDAGAARRLAERAGVAFVEGRLPPAPPSRPGPPRRVPLAPWLLGVAAALLVADLALRNAGDGRE